MNLLGNLTGNLTNGVSGMLMDNFLPIAAVVGIGAYLNSQGVDVIGNLGEFANNAVGAFLNLIDGLGKEPQSLEQTQQTQVPDFKETYGENYVASELTKEEQKAGIKEVLMNAGASDTPDTILDKASEKLHLTDEQKESSRGIINDVYHEMVGDVSNLFRAATDREGLVNDAINSAEQKGLFDVIGNTQSIGKQTVSQETAQAAIPQKETDTKVQTKTRSKPTQDIGMDR